MNHNFKTNDAAEILASIREVLSDANRALDYGEDTGWRIEEAFVRLRIFLEAAELLEALKSVKRMEVQASKKWSEIETDDDGEPWLVWSGKLHRYLAALEAALGHPKDTFVTKDVVQILRATQYSITDTQCFQNPPANENDVHVRVEAVLRCIFPDLRHKPPIAKPIKNFQPDTGLPSINTLIEYKFIADLGEEKRIADELLADTRGYTSADWKNFIYVIYETKRIKPENQWQQLLQASDVGPNTQVIVISGEEPSRSATAKPVKPSR